MVFDEDLGMNICDFGTKKHSSSTYCYVCGKSICKKHATVQKKAKQKFCRVCRKWKDCKDHPKSVEVMTQHLGYTCPDHS